MLNLTKKIAVVGVIAFIHFGASALIVAISMAVLTAVDPVPAEPTVGVRILVAATRVLHFPIISLSWYPRPWFPGNWIYLPILANSFIWAVAIYGLYLLGKKTMRFWVQRSALRVIRKRKQ